MSSPKTSPITIVDACFTDFYTISTIYSHYVLHDVCTFELIPPDAEEMFTRGVSARQQGLPVLAAYKDDKVVGYAYASEYRPRLAYRFTVEDSVFVAPECRGQGIGKMLLEELLRKCAGVGKCQMLAVCSGGEESIRLHEAFGFKQVGVLKDVGFKFEKWVDTVFLQKSLRREGVRNDSAVLST